MTPDEIKTELEESEAEPKPDIKLKTLVSLDFNAGEEE